jgi:hypothetical protein
MSKKDIIKRLNERMIQRLGDEWYIIKELMNEIGAVISGSIILQCILNQEWEDSDIDIFCPYSKYNYTSSNNPTSKIDKILCSKFGLYHYNSCRYIQNMPLGYNIKFIRNYKCINNASVQTIIADNKNISDFIMSNFDFDICKNIYSIVDNIEHIYIHDLDSIINKEIYWKQTGNVNSTNIRIYKYLKRGFNIKLPDDFLEICEKSKAIQLSPNLKIDENNNRIYDQFGSNYQCSKKDCIYNLLNVVHIHDYKDIHVSYHKIMYVKPEKLITNIYAQTKN